MDAEGQQIRPPSWRRGQDVGGLVIVSNVRIHHSTCKHCDLGSLRHTTMTSNTGTEAGRPKGFLSDRRAIRLIRRLAGARGLNISPIDIVRKKGRQKACIYGRLICTCTV